MKEKIVKFKNKIKTIYDSLKNNEKTLKNN